MGPWIGPLGIMIGLPVVAYGLVYTCNAAGCSLLKGPASWPGFPPGTQLFTWQALGVYMGWILAQVLIQASFKGATGPCDKPQWYVTVLAVQPDDLHI